MCYKVGTFACETTTMTKVTHEEAVVLMLTLAVVARR